MKHALILQLDAETLRRLESSAHAAGLEPDIHAALLLREALSIDQPVSLEAALGESRGYVKTTLADR